MEQQPSCETTSINYDMDVAYAALDEYHQATAGVVTREATQRARAEFSRRLAEQAGFRPNLFAKGRQLLSVPAGRYRHRDLHVFLRNPQKTTRGSLDCGPRPDIAIEIDVLGGGGAHYTVHSTLRQLNDLNPA